MAFSCEVQPGEQSAMLLTQTSLTGEEKQWRIAYFPRQSHCQHRAGFKATSDGSSGLSDLSVRVDLYSISQCIQLYVSR